MKATSNTLCCNAFNAIKETNHNNVAATAAAATFKESASLPQDRYQLSHICTDIEQKVSCNAPDRTAGHQQTLIQKL